MWSDGKWVTVNLQEQTVLLSHYQHFTIPGVHNTIWGMAKGKILSSNDFWTSSSFPDLSLLTG